LIGPIGFYIRRHLPETPQFLSANATPTPLRDVLLRQPVHVLLAIGALIVSNSSNYLILYMPTFAVTQLDLPVPGGFVATLLGGMILTLGAPCIGHWSDGGGRTGIMLSASALLALSALPTFLLLVSYASISLLIVVVCWFSRLKTFYCAALPSLLADIFPFQTRCTGLSLSYNISVPLFGGFTPLIATWLIEATGFKIAPCFYLISTALVSFGVLIFVRRRFRLD
jgi:MFS transporter, MHS family, proline/betaine transporter